MISDVREQETISKYPVRSPIPEIVMGYTAREDLPEADYDADKDISFYPGLAESYIPVKPGMFAIFFPQDAHAPGVSPDGVKKVIVKVLV